jgi:hypothetical protein
MLSAEEVKVAKKAKAKEAKARKVAAVKQVEKGKVGQVRTSIRKAKITTDQGWIKVIMKGKWNSRQLVARITLDQTRSD